MTVVLAFLGSLVNLPAMALLVDRVGEALTPQPRSTAAVFG